VTGYCGRADPGRDTIAEIRARRDYDSALGEESTHWAEQHHHQSTDQGRHDEPVLEC
jgi:hypothetical protein